MSASDTTTTGSSSEPASAVPPASPPGPRLPAPPRGITTRFLRSELWLIFGRRRNWAGLAVLASVPVIIAVVVKFSGSRADGGPNFFSAITENGVFVALAALSAELGLFLPIAVAAISADTIAGEAGTGTLRYLLTVPVGRTRLLVIKYTAVVIFSFAVTLLVAVTGTVVGLALFGGGPVTLVSGTQVPLAQGLLRLLAVCAYLSVCLSALGAIGLFVSTLTEQALGATIAIIMLCLTSFILDVIPQLEWLHPYLPTHWWLAFGDLLRAPMALTDDLRSGLLTALSYILVFTAAAWARLHSRDLTC